MKSLTLFVFLFTLKGFCQIKGIDLNNNGRLLVKTLVYSDTVYHNPPIEKKVKAFIVADSGGYLKQVELKVVIKSQIKSDLKLGYYTSLGNDYEVLVLRPYLRNHEYFYLYNGKKVDTVYWPVPERISLPISNDAKPIVLGHK